MRKRLRGGRLRLAVRGPRRLVRRIQIVTFRVNRRIVRVDHTRPYRTTLRLRRYRKRAPRVRAVVAFGNAKRRVLR